jgi:predicted nucleic acid-binding protein
VRVLPDTPIWSAAFRRAEGVDSAYRRQMERLVVQGMVEIIGPIRQELLSGIRESTQFERVRERLRRFQDLEVTPEDYEEAATYCNRCRSKGIQGSSTDLPICAISVRHDLAIFTDDRNFLSYKSALPIRLFQPDA